MKINKILLKILKYKKIKSRNKIILFNKRLHKIQLYKKIKEVHKIIPYKIMKLKI